MTGLAILIAVPPSAWSDSPATVLACPPGARGEKPAPASPAGLCIVENQARHEGAFIVLDARLKNASARPVTDAQVTVELSTSAGRVLDVEDSVVRPDRVMPGQDAVLLVVAPYRVTIAAVRYLFTWEQAGRARHGVAERSIAFRGPESRQGPSTRVGRGGPSPPGGPA